MTFTELRQLVNALSLDEKIRLHAELDAELPPDDYWDRDAVRADAVQMLPG